MAGNAKGGKRTDSIIIGAFVCGVFFLYVLSYGPAACLLLRGHIDRQAFEWLYWPLHCLSHVSVIDEGLRRYVAFLARLTNS